MHIHTLVVVLAIGALSSPVHADTAPSDTTGTLYSENDDLGLGSGSPGAASTVIPHESEVETTKTYRGWLVGTSATSLGLVVLGAVSEGEGGRDTGASDAFFTLGLSSFVLSGPIVHLAHGNPGTAVGSLLMRAFIPGLAMAVAVESADCDEFLCELDHAGEAWLIGAVLVTAIDGVWLAKNTNQERSSPKVLPYAGVTGASGLVGLSGLF